MDPRDRADAMLARARARRGYIVTPDDAVSPMDASSTLQIPRAVVTDLDDVEEAGPTASIPSPHARQAPPPRQHADVTQPLPPTDAAETGEASGDDHLEETRTEGIVPTVQQSRPNMRSLSQRLGGE